MPPLMSNHGNYIVSLGALCIWLGEQAAELGVEVYPGFAASEVLYDENNAVVGIATGDMGVGRDGQPTESFVRGMELRGKYTFFAEGARGSLTKQLVEEFKLSEGRDPQKYGIGLKELWQVEAGEPQAGPGAALVRLAARRPHRRRLVPLPLRRQSRVGGLRAAPQLREPVRGAVRGIPALQDAPGDPRDLRGRQAHRLWRARHHRGRLAVDPQARFSRRRAARLRGRFHERAAHQGQPQRHAVGHRRGGGGVRGAEPKAARTTSSPPIRRRCYAGDIARDLKPVRNAKPLWSRFGTYIGIALGGLDMWINTIIPGGLPFTLKHRKPDYATLKRAENAAPIAYPKPDGVLTFDRLTSVSFSGTNHEENQPVHLKLTDPAMPVAINLPEFAEPAQRYCPAAVYEIVAEHGRGPAFSDQRAELRPLQNVRYQGSEPEHHVGLPRGWRGPELRRNVSRIAAVEGFFTASVEFAVQRYPLGACRQIAALFARLWRSGESAHVPPRRISLNAGQPSQRVAFYGNRHRHVHRRPQPHSSCQRLHARKRTPVRCSAATLPPTSPRVPTTTTAPPPSIAAPSPSTPTTSFCSSRPSRRRPPRRIGNEPFPWPASSSPRAPRTAWPTCCSASTASRTATTSRRTTSSARRPTGRSAS